ncbi:MAG: hypothetical protein ACOX0A_07850 [Thermoguttaceae bacterium]|jgi:hypothetical protein
MAWRCVKLLMRRIAAPIAILYSLAAIVLNWRNGVVEFFSDVQGGAPLSGSPSLGYRVVCFAVVLSVVCVGLSVAYLRWIKIRKEGKELLPRLERLRAELAAFQATHGRFPATVDEFEPNVGADAAEPRLLFLGEYEPIAIAGKTALVAPTKALVGPFGKRIYAILDDGSLFKSDNIFRIELFYEQVADALRCSVRFPDLRTIAKIAFAPILLAAGIAFFLNALLSDVAIPLVPQFLNAIRWDGPKSVGITLVGILGYFLVESAVDYFRLCARKINRPPSWTLILLATPTLLYVGAIALKLVKGT